MLRLFDTLKLPRRLPRAGESHMEIFDSFCPKEIGWIRKFLSEALFDFKVAQIGFWKVTCDGLLTRAIALIAGAKFRILKLPQYAGIAPQSVVGASGDSSSVVRSESAQWRTSVRRLNAPFAKRIR
jgi:hypothetical protein